MKNVEQGLPDSTTKTGTFANGHAVIIGIANYLSVSPLPETVLNDARDVASVLTSDAHCGYNHRNVCLLLDGNATLARIQEALSFVAKSSGPDDTVVIFFSGHGALLGGSDDPLSAILPVDCDGRTLDSSSLSETEFSAALRQISARRLLVLIDACHSGGAGSFKVEGSPKLQMLRFSEKSLDRLAQGTGRVLMASSRASEISLILQGARNSVFTGHLLEILRGRGRTSGDGVIRVFDIFNHVAERVKRTVPGRQHPIFKASDLEDNFPVVLDRGGMKSDIPSNPSESSPDIWERLGNIMPELYPMGPTDQEIWVRSGGDLSRLRLSGTGRANWLAALRTLRQGGGGSGIRKEHLVESALDDYPHHPELTILLHH